MSWAYTPDLSKVAELGIFHFPTPTTQKARLLPYNDSKRAISMSIQAFTLVCSFHFGEKFQEQDSKRTLLLLRLTFDYHLQIKDFFPYPPNFGAANTEKSFFSAES